MKLNSMHDLYVSELKDLYDGEHRIVKALPDMVEAAKSPELRAALQHHLDETWGHVRRLEEIFQRLGESPKGQKCKGLVGILDEGEDFMDEDAPAGVADSALIASAQRVEHYEIAAYGTVRNWARGLGYDDQAELLQETLDEEKAADQKLTSVAESFLTEKTAR